ncbi:MAG: hypothetical protein WBA57_14270 [Elainellaceae cyanobacterium]
MNHPSNNASTFSNHVYDFGQHIYVNPIRQGGVVDGIWQQACGIVYHVTGLSQGNSEWWPESQLQAACPSCLNPWIRDSRDACVHCGYIQSFN